MTRRLLLSALAALLAALALAARSGAAEPPALTVLAAASLTESLQAAAAAWTAQGNPAVAFSFESSSKLAKQVEAGVPADAFFSADAGWMDYLQQRGLIDPATRVDLLGNTLVAVIPAGSSLPVRAAADLARPEIRRLGLAGENVPAGRYARAALQSLGVWPGAQARVISGDNVRTVLGWVASGEVDAGVVYATDARVEPRVKVAFPFPAGSYPAIVYPAAALEGAAHAQEAASFLSFCRSPAGMAIFAAAGFPPPPAR